MYPRYRMMKLYNRVQLLAEDAWEVIQWTAIVVCLFMAISFVIVGLTRDARDRGREEMKRENFEVHKQMQKTPGVKSGTRTR